MIRPSSLLFLWKILLPLLLLIPFHVCYANGSKNEIYYPEAEDGYDSGFSFGKIHLSGEGGVGFFDTGPQGQFPNDEFLVDEAKIFVEAEIVKSIYFYGELNLVTREETDENFQLGELYVEFEGLSRFWTNEQLLNARVGRFDIPFGEEYLTRDAIDNPLISHSLPDVWGVDEGVEAYGAWKALNYVIAVQNGGDPILHDFNADKAVVGQIKYNCTKKIHFSFSAMRTGRLDVQQDKLSELWFGNAHLRPIGSPIVTSTFQGNLIEGDAYTGWKSGHVHGDAGELHYEDNDTTEENNRDVSYFQVELVQNFYNNNDKTFYAATRFSRMNCAQGFPMVGNGNPDLFWYSNNNLTKWLWRLSFGIGYRLKRNLLLKTEYNIEHGLELNGSKRDEENFFGTEVAFQF
jgi:hypothetical protein